MSGGERFSGGRREADTMTEGPVLVAVEDPDDVQQLVRTAGDLARRGTGVVRLVTVVAKPRDSPFGVFDDETIRRNYAGDSRDLLARADPPEGVAVERDVVVARSVVGGVLAVVEESDPAALVVGWRGRTRRSDVVLGTVVDALVDRAPCDLYVERVGREANGVASILLPVAGGPHVRAAANVVAAIAARNDARVHVFSVAGDDVGDASAFVEEGLAALTAADPDLSATTGTREADDVTGAIAEEAADHDVVVLGATRQGALRRRIVGSVPQRVVERTDETVILARGRGTVKGPLGRLGALLRR